MNTSIDWERVEPGLEVWETEDGYRLEKYTAQGVRGDRRLLMCTAPDRSTFYSGDQDDIDRCVQTHREQSL